MRKALPLLVLVVVALFAVAACGGGDEEGEEAEPQPAETAATETEEEAAAEGDPAAGKEVFLSAGCGNCHTLEDAGTTGTTAPNLDEAQPSLDEAVTQIRNGGGGMPAFEGKLSDEEIQNVAAYVVEASGG